MSMPARVRESAAICLLLLGCAGLYARALDAPKMFGWDESEYAALGRSLLRGEGFSISGQPNRLRPPVLPLAAAAGLWLGGAAADDMSARRITLVFSVLAVLAVIVNTWGALAFRGYSW